MTAQMAKIRKHPQKKRREPLKKEFQETILISFRDLCKSNNVSQYDGE